MIKEIIINSFKHFLIQNENISLLLKINNGKIELLNFGLPIDEIDIASLSLPKYLEYGNSILYDEDDLSSCLNVRPLAFSEFGIGDFREPAISIDINNKNITCDFVFDSFNIINGLDNVNSVLPNAHSNSSNIKTLEIVMHANYDNNIILKLYFTLFDTCITRRSVLLNNSNNIISLNKLASSLVDLKGEYDIITLDGGWNREAYINRVSIKNSKVVNESRCGFSSNFHNPGFILLDKDTLEDSGFAYAFNLIYSGNHYSSCQLSIQNLTRVVQGINFEDFRKDLKNGDSFITPVSVMTFSNKGLNGVSNNMHHFINENIVPSNFKYKPRPIIYNSWEGCMFDFNEKKLIHLAKEAKAMGCELFVLDDGWFGKRDNDFAGLGDYTVNKKKLPNGIKGLADKINKLGMKFGLWFEPEAVNPDSDLYRSHPEWAIHLENIKDLYGRHELLLDLRKEEVRDYIVSNVCNILDSCNIEYVKWDMNRESVLRGNDSHDYILGLYEVLHRIFDSRPNILLEHCSSGGNRFDLGMLSFAPQIWTSDDTDPVERVIIQNGISYLYPLSTISNHVSLSPHSQTLRSTPLSTRNNVSFFGVYGIELELKYLLPIENTEIKEAIEFYKNYRELIVSGEFYKYIKDDLTTWIVKSKDDSKAIVMIYKEVSHSSSGYEWLKINNLNDDYHYKLWTKNQYVRIGDFGSLINFISPINLNPNGLILKEIDARYKMSDGKLELVLSGKALKNGITLPIRYLGTGNSDDIRKQNDFGSNIYIIERVDK